MSACEDDTAGSQSELDEGIILKNVKYVTYVV